MTSSRRTIVLLLWVIGSTAGCSVAAEEATSPALASADTVATTLYRTDAIADFELTIDQAGLASLAAAPKVEVPATFVHAGTSYAVDLKLKGGVGSLRDFSSKPSFKLKFKGGQRFFGLKSLTLNNMIQDASSTHEVLAYSVYSAAGVPVPQTGYARVKVNGEAFGLYLNLESIDKPFLARNFADATGPVYEGAYGTDLRASDVEKYDPSGGDDPGQAQLRALVAAVDVPGDGVFYGPDAVIDTPAFLSMAAVSVMIGDWDNYAAANNYRIYRDPSRGRWTFVPTGTDQTFGTPVDVFGSKGILFQKCLASERCTVDFVKRLGEVVDLVEGMDLARKSAALTATIDAAVAADPRSPYSAADVAAQRASTLAFISARPSAVRPALACVANGHETAPAACAGQLVTNVASGTCLDAAHDWAGSSVHAWPCHGEGNQRWDFVPRADGFVQVVSRASGRCLDAFLGSFADGTGTQIWDCHEGDNQLWTVERRPSGTRLVSKYSGKCLDLDNGSRAPGARISLWRCHDGTNQAWTQPRSLHD